MGKIKISAVGQLKEKIPAEQEIEIDQPLTAFELVSTYFNIPNTESRLSFIINGRMAQGTHVIKPGDVIRVLKMGGAG